MDVLVVGAGMAGLTCARQLRDHGHRVTVVDKARAVGGRMASRRLAGARFDTGAQHFSARSPVFAAEVDRLHRLGVVRVWFETQSLTEPERGIEPRWIGQPAMRSVAEHLAEGLEARLETPIDRLEAEGGRVAAITAGGARLVAQVAVVTAPAPQTLHLLRALPLGPEADAVSSFTYHPCLAALAILDRPSGLEQGHRALDEGPVAWIADNQHKMVSPAPAVTIHSSPGFASEWLEEPPGVWAPRLVAAAADHLAGRAVRIDGHRWRYSLPVNPSDRGAVLVSIEPPVVVAGEAFAGARVEGAFLSGMRAAEMVASSFS